MRLKKWISGKEVHISIAVAALMMIFAVSACEQDGTGDLSSDTGKLKVELTDAPFNVDLVEEANVTITRIEARKAAAADADSANPFIDLYNETQTFNLLELQNGVTETLANLEVPAGQYDLVRMYVDQASLTLTNGKTYDVKVPSGEATGIKIFIDPALEVRGGLTAELLLDFDVSQSFVMKGNLNTPAGVNGFNFKPVIRAVNNSTAGRVDGVVTDTSASALANAAVWLEKDTTVSTTYTDSSGNYAILGVKEGAYSLYAAKEGYDTLKVDNIEITAANVTTRDLELVPSESSTSE